MRFHVTRAYLDLARAVIDTQVSGDLHEEDSQDAFLALASCTYLYSYMALTSFASKALHDIWSEPASALRAKHPNRSSFEELMKYDLGELKSALAALAEQKKLEPLHRSLPNDWRLLNELVKRHRDFFVHPNPEAFNGMVTSWSNYEWGMPSQLAERVISHFYQALGIPVPEWVRKPRLRSKGFAYSAS